MFWNCNWPYQSYCWAAAIVPPEIFDTVLRMQQNTESPTECVAVSTKCHTTVPVRDLSRRVWPSTWKIRGVAVGVFPVHDAGDQRLFGALHIFHQPLTSLTQRSVTHSVVRMNTFNICQHQKRKTTMLHMQFQLLSSLSIGVMVSNQILLSRTHSVQGIQHLMFHK